MMRLREGDHMSDYTEWLRASALAVSTHNERLSRFVSTFINALVEPPYETCVLNLSEFPPALEQCWDRDRRIILEMIFAECGKDLSESLTFELYASARARRSLIMTEPTAVERGRINVVRVPTKELVVANDWAVMLSVYGADEWFSEAAWIARLVREPMTQAWTGYAMIELFAVINTVIASEREPKRSSGISLADAFRHCEHPSNELVMRVGTADLRRQLLQQVFPGSELAQIPYGRILNRQAIDIYRDAVREDFARILGPPAHRLEAEMRETVLDEATIAQCVGMRMLPTMLKTLLNQSG